MKIVHNLWQVGGGDMTAPEDAATYLLQLGKQATPIDAANGNAHHRLIENNAPFENIRRKIMQIQIG
jgi:hypothetical protein